MAIQFSPLIILLIVSLVMLPHTIQSKKPSEVTKGGQAFSFLQHLEGCHKGQNVKGLHELKQYLNRFGYLNYEGTPQNIDTDAKNDEFDDLLESAIKTYQLNYHLKVTGNLDSHTVNQMMMPRCGVPDIINGTTSMRSGKKKNHNHGPPSLFHTVSHYSFFPEAPRWPSSQTNLTYRFQSSVQVNGMENINSICQRAFARWAAVSHFTFQEVQDGADANIVIGFHRGDHGDTDPFTGPGGSLAHAFAPTNGRFHYDADENWGTGPSPGVFDLESVAVHEIGHLLGLGHSSVRGAIMYPTIPDGVRLTELHGDDVQGIRALYGFS